MTIIVVGGATQEPPVVPEIKEVHIGDGLLRFVKKISAQSNEIFDVAEMIHIGAKIGGRTIAVIDGNFEKFFRTQGIVERYVPAVELPVLEIRKAPRHSEIIAALWPGDCELKPLSLFHFHQTMAGDGRISPDTNLFDGQTNIGYAYSPIARPNVENDSRLWAVTWYVSKTLYPGELCIGAAPWNFFARCSTMGRVMAEYVVPVEIPAGVSPMETAVVV